MNLGELRNLRDENLATAWNAWVKCPESDDCPFPHTVDELRHRLTASLWKDLHLALMHAITRPDREGRPREQILRLLHFPGASSPFFDSCCLCEFVMPSGEVHFVVILMP